MGRKRKTKFGTDGSTTSQESVRQDSKIQKPWLTLKWNLTAIIDRLDQLWKQTNAGFKQLHEFDTLKLEIKAIKTVIRDLEKVPEFIINDVEDLKLSTNDEETKRITLTGRIDCLEKHVQDLTKESRQEKENRLNLEQYTRRENLIFN